MRLMFLWASLVLWCRLAVAGSSAIWWPGWSVSSSEDLSEKPKYSSYPLSLMFDGDPATAWVYSSTLDDRDKAQWPTRYGVELEPRRPIVVDGLRMMNGQNQNPARFRRNNRVVQIRVTLTTGRKKSLKTFGLSDRMGWHSVSWPRVAVNGVKIELTGLHQGRDNDVCISELQLLSHGRNIKMGMPRAVMFYDGLEGCGAALLISRAGKVLDGIATEVGYKDKWNSNGRFVSGFAFGSAPHLWIADAWQGRIIRSIPQPGSNPEPDYAWINSNTLRLTAAKNGGDTIIRLP